MPNEYIKTLLDTHSIPNVIVSELMAAVLEKNVPFRFSASGFSMYPFIKNGDLITLSTGPYRLGDVVAFINQENGKLTVHRIVQISPAGYLIKGDNVSGVDGCFPPSGMIGKVIRVERHSRTVRAGLGFERPLVAFLSRQGWLWPVIRFLYIFLKPIKFLKKRCSHGFPPSRE